MTESAVKIISVEEPFRVFLPFLYPSYTVIDRLGKLSEFIIVLDITSPKEKLSLGRFSFGIVISTKVFDEVWDRKVFIQKALDFRRLNFKSKKRTLTEFDDLDDEDFINSLIQFITTGSYDLPEETKILELFDSIGSKRFIDVYLNSYHPTYKNSVLTFLSKCLSEANTSYYLRKKSLLENKIRTRFPKCYENYKFKDQSDHLQFCKFIIDLTC